MIAIQLIRDNAQFVKERLAIKNFPQQKLYKVIKFIMKNPDEQKEKFYNHGVDIVNK